MSIGSCDAIIPSHVYSGEGNQYPYSEENQYPYSEENLPPMCLIRSRIAVFNIESMGVDARCHIMKQFKAWGAKPVEVDVKFHDAAERYPKAAFVAVNLSQDEAKQWIYYWGDFIRCGFELNFNGLVFGHWRVEMAKHQPTSVLTFQEAMALIAKKELAKAMTGVKKSIDTTRYKTRLCISFKVQGFCKYGAKCHYAHGPEDIRAPSEVAQAAQPYHSQYEPTMQYTNTYDPHASCNWASMQYTYDPNWASQYESTTQYTHNPYAGQKEGDSPRSTSSQSVECCSTPVSCGYSSEEERRSQPSAEECQYDPTPSCYQRTPYGVQAQTTTYYYPLFAPAAAY